MPNSETINDLWFMKMAIEEAQRASYQDEVPIGAVIVDQNLKVVSTGHNQKEEKFDVTSHAEIEAIKKLSKNLSSWRLGGYTLYVTLEPCPMCLSALLQSRIQRVVFGAYDSKGGAISLGYNFSDDRRLNHHFSITGGILHYECSKLLSDYFKRKRS